MYDFLIFAHYFFVFKEFFSENYILDCVLTIIICTFLDQTRLKIYNQMWMRKKNFYIYCNWYKSLQLKR